MQCYCGAGEDHLPFLYREFSDKREVRLFLFWESVVQVEKYERQYQKFAKIYPTVKDLFTELL